MFYPAFKSALQGKCFQELFDLVIEKRHQLSSWIYPNQNKHTRNINLLFGRQSPQENVSQPQEL
jgi:hypothetical protein